MVRTENQDYFGQFPSGEQKLSYTQGLLFTVADGMGGHERGREASETAVRVIHETYYASSSGIVVTDLKKAIQAANQEIFNIASSGSSFVKMGTTCSSLVLREDQAFIGHVGDSRVYRINSDGIVQLTQDHTQVAEMYRKGILSKEEATGHPSKSVLVRALGVNPEIEIDLIENIKLENEDYFIICSDGLGKVSKEEIKDIVLRSTPQEACDALVNLANERGGHDNITVQVIQIHEKEIVTKPEEPVQMSKPGKSWVRWLFLILIIAGISWIGYRYHQNILSWLGIQMGKLGEEDISRESLRSDRSLEGAEISSDVNNLLVEAEGLKRVSKWDAALKIYQGILQGDPMNLASVNGINEIARAYKSKADQLQDERDYQGAIIHYNKALNLQPKNQELRNSIQACENALENPVSNLEPSVTKLPEDENKLVESVDEAVSDRNIGGVNRNILVEGYQPSQWHFSGLTENDYSCNASSITFLDNPTAKKAILDKDFDDINVEVVAKVNHISKIGKYGLVVGYRTKDGNEAEKYYLFAVHGQKNFTLERISGSQSEQLLSIPFPSEELDKADILTLKVKCLGPWIMVYNNQKLLKAWLSQKFIRGKVGLFADPNKQVLFSDFKVSPAIKNENELNE
jgi:protein phosphatase